jgi:olefin beta-lactone synthetase
MTLLSAFAGRLATQPEHPALISAGGETLTYEALDSWAAALAQRYAHAGVRANTRVVVALGMSCELYAALIALWRLGAVAVFPEPAAGLKGLRHALAVTAPEFLIGPRRVALLCALASGRLALATPLPLPREHGTAHDPPSWPDAHPALITFTSGSTGQPKGILRSHGFLLAQQRALTSLLQPAEPTRDLVCLPMFVLAGLSLGTTSALPRGDVRRPTPELAILLSRQIDEQQLTRLLASPSIVATLAQTSAIAGLRQIFTGGGPIWPTLMQRLLEVAPRAQITAVYGSTEAEPIAHLAIRDITPTDWQRMEAGEGLPAGRPVPEIALRVIDDEIQVSGEHVNSGYLDPADDRSNKIREGSTIWHRTGDAGRLDERGSLWLLGRLEGRVGAWFPFQVEVAARAWPGVEQAALVNLDGHACLVLTGDAHRKNEWLMGTQQFAGLDLAVVSAIPLDQRHHAKVDYRRLRAMLRSRGS